MQLSSLEAHLNHYKFSGYFWTRDESPSPLSGDRISPFLSNKNVAGNKSIDPLNEEPIIKGTSNIVPEFTTWDFNEIKPSNCQFKTFAGIPTQAAESLADLSSAK